MNLVRPLQGVALVPFRHL